MKKELFLLDNLTSRERDRMKLRKDHLAHYYVVHTSGEYSLTDLPMGDHNTVFVHVTPTLEKLSERDGEVRLEDCFNACLSLAVMAEVAKEVVKGSIIECHVNDEVVGELSVVFLKTFVEGDGLEEFRELLNKSRSFLAVVHNEGFQQRLANLTNEFNRKMKVDTADPSLP